MKRARGFTLIELLVVVAIIGVLIAILIPSLGRVKETARRTVCGTNLKSQGAALAIYAQQFSDTLPQFDNAAGYWVHDEPWEFAETLMNVSRQTANSMSATSMRKWFYCPSNAESNVDLLWDYGVQHSLTYRAHGYTGLNDRKGGNYPALPQRNGSPKLVYHSKMMGTIQAGDAELIVDEILSPDNSGGASQFNVPPPTNAAPAGTSHLKGRKPSGQNVLACDGHVAWRTFPSGNSGFIAIQNAGNSFAWVVNP